MAISDSQFVSGYLEHLRYRGGRTVCLETLNALHRAHLARVPFENLALLEDGFEPDLTHDHLFDRIVRRGRGGVCYELNTAFYDLLTAMGFDACQVSGCVQPGEDMFSHVATLVRLPEGTYLADVGFGDTDFPPIPVGPETTREGETEYFFDFCDATTAEVMCRRAGAPARRLYTLSLTPRAMDDYLPRFRWAAAKGNTVFSMRPICVSRADGRRTSLRRGVLTVEQNGQILESRPVAPGDETRQCLREYFHLL